MAWHLKCMGPDEVAEFMLPVEQGKHAMIFESSHFLPLTDYYNLLLPM